jgi:hypothetical protein
VEAVSNEVVLRHGVVTPKPLGGYQARVARVTMGE